MGIAWTIGGREMLGNRCRSARGSVSVWVAGALLALAISIVWLGLPRKPVAGHVDVATAGAGSQQVYLSGESAVLFRTGNRLNLPDEKGVVPYEGNENGNRHVVQVSRRAAEQAAAVNGSLVIELPSGETFRVVFERTERAPNGDWTFVGKVATRLGPQTAVLTFGRAGLFGVLPVPEGTQMQLTTTRRVTVLEPVRPMHPRDPGTGQLPVDYVVPPQGTDDPARKSGSGPALFRVNPATSPIGQRLPMTVAKGQFPLSVAATVVSEVQIDVLGLYTQNMVELRGSVAAAETECNNYLAIANQAHRDSGTGVKLNFVGLRQVDYPADGLNAQALNNLQDNQLPDGTDVHALRDTLRADLVALLRPYATGDTNGGIANLAGAGLRGVEGANEFSAYSVSNLSSYTFAHETGHNLGSNHDLTTSTVDGVPCYGAYPFSFGYRQDGPPAFATIMAYPAIGQPWIGYFSHPGTTACLNVACGTESADNARSMRAMAPALAEYRLPANQILVNAASVVEGDPGSLWARSVSISVRLSTPALAGGVRFDIRTENGTAVAGADYSAWSQSGVVIPEGESTRRFTVNILPDAMVEGDENFTVVLSNVMGAGIYREAATVRILDDDPRMVVSGRFLAPPGYSMPTGQFQIAVYEQGNGGYQQASYLVYPPHFEYRVPIQAGSSVSIATYAPAPFAQATFDLGIVTGNQTRDLILKPAVKLTGSLRFAPGQTVPTSPIQIIAWGATGTDSGTGFTASPPSFAFSFDVVQGAEVRLDAYDPPAPFVRQQVALGELWSDRVQDISMGSVPSMVMTGARVPEGISGQDQTVYLSLYLSTAAPTGGAQVDVEVVDGTATAGSDFVEKAKTRITLSAGNSFYSFPLVIKGDAVPEPTEWFKVVLSNPSGAWLPSPEAIVHIENDDFGVLRNDFDGDGRSDVFWRNLADGRDILWWGAEFANQFNPGQVANLAWRVVGAGDFDGDGTGDLFWRNSSNGQNIVWPSGNSQGKRYAATVSSPDWKVAAIADFNGDGRADIFWRNSASGQDSIWWSGNSSIATTELTVPAAWMVAGSGDFNGDGEDDVLWRNTSTGANIVWWSGDYAGYAALNGVTNQAWEVVAIGDYAGDGVADVFWRNRTTGENIIWWNGSYGSQVREPTISVAWKVVASGDYDGDGQVDLFWRNATTGANVVWDSGRYARRRNVTGVSNAAWVVQQ